METMKQLSRVAAAAAFVAGVLAAGQAAATPVCTSCNYTGNTYLGQHNPVTGEGAGYRHDMGQPTPSSFTDVWVFDIAPTGGFQLNGSWQRTPGGFSAFSVQLFALTANPTCGALGSSCAGVAFNSMTPIDASVPVGGFTTGLYSMPNITLNAGWYAFVVSGTVTGVAATNYSGQIATNAVEIPEPASLALVGLAMLGAAAGMRRNAKA
jgi:hypothetical protein